jgi:hypothetical protein
MEYIQLPPHAQAWSDIVQLSYRKSEEFHISSKWKTAYELEHLLHVNSRDFRLFSYKELPPWNPNAYGLNQYIYKPTTTGLPVYPVWTK